MLLSIVNKIINHYLPQHLDLTALNGKTVAFVCSNFNNQTLYVLFTDQSLEISTNTCAEVALQFTGTMEEFLKLLLAFPGGQHMEYAKSLTIEGNVDIAQEIYHLLQQIEISSINYGRLNTIGEMIKDYLTEEKQYILQPAEIEDYNNAVDKIKDRLARLQARINQATAYAKLC